MIEELHIENLGVIEKAHLTFGPGLNAVTGETGAGKSMLLQSLALLLGKRADPAKIRHGHDTLTVDGIFTSDDAPTLRQRVEDAGGIIDDDNLIYISRSVTAKGRSRVSVCARPTPVGLLTHMADDLVTIHGQSDQQRLLSPASQRQFVDTFGGEKLREVFTAYQEAYGAWKKLCDDYAQWKTQTQQRQEEIQRLSDGLELVEALELHKDEDLEIKTRIERLMNAEDLRNEVLSALALLRGDDSSWGNDISVLSALAQATSHLEGAHAMDASFNETLTTLRNVDAIISDITGTLADYVADLEADPAQLQADHERLAAIKNACHGRADDVNGLLTWANEASERLRELDNPDNTDEAWQENINRAEKTLKDLATTLREKRVQAAKTLSAQATEEIRGLAMKDATLHIDVTPRDDLRSYGSEDIAFMLSPHQGAPALPLNKTASGGELSRIMLALEVSQLGAHSGTDGATCPTLVFDEIDAGIGGNTAALVAKRLARLAQKRQVIVVTHVASMAAQATTHVIVDKTGDTTTVRQLTPEERRGEIARMLSGDKTLPAALKHAQELLDNAHKE